MPMAQKWDLHQFLLLVRLSVSSSGGGLFGALCDSEKDPERLLIFPLSCRPAVQKTINSDRPQLSILDSIRSRHLSNRRNVFAICGKRLNIATHRSQSLLSIAG